MQFTVNTQALASITRQALAVAATVFGILAAATSTLHLPTAIAAILTATGPILLSVEHYLSDPSTGTPPPARTAPPFTSTGTTTNTGVPAAAFAPGMANPQ